MLRPPSGRPPGILGRPALVVFLALLLGFEFLGVGSLGITAESVPVSGPTAASFDELRRQYESSEGQSPVERLPIITALGECEDPRAGQYLAGILAKGGKQTVLFGVILGALGSRGDDVAIEAALTHGFRLLPEHEWRTIRDAYLGKLQPSGESWLLEKGYRGVPKMEPRAQRIVIELMRSTQDERAGLAAKSLLGNRKIPGDVQALLVDLIRLHRVDGAAKKISRMFRYDDADLQVAVLRALRDLEAEEHSKTFHQGLESRHWTVRAVAADIFGDTRDPALVNAIAPLLEDAFPEVQVAAVQALRKIGGRDVVPPLIAALEEAPGRVRDDIADALLWLTGEDLGTEPLSWESWWSVHGETAEVKGITREEYDRLREESANAQTGTYYGLRVISKYVTFVIDVSGSMEEPYLAEVDEPGEEPESGGGTSVSPKGGGGKGGKTRRAERRKIEVARSELSRALRGLKNGTQFNLIPFDSMYTPWRPILVEMSDELREEALGFVSNLKPGGNTNIYDTLMSALEDPDVNTIYFLSDGAPTTGRITDPEAILAAVAEANQVRKVKIHTIGFHLDPVAESLMRRLAEQNYGSFVKK